VIRTIIAVALLGFLAAGCGEGHRPAVRGVPIEPEKESPHSAKAPADSFHGGMGGMDGMTGMGGMTESPPAPSLGPEVDLGTARLTAPKDWTRKQPRSGFTVAEFGLPRAEGDPEDGRLTVTQAGGGIKDNVDRWRGQFIGKLAKESEEKIKVSSVEVTLVDFTGTYRDPFSQAGEQANYRMLGAIFESGGKMNFIKAYGPEKTMAARGKEFREFVESLKTK
jgi:hypothetical protein